jgi:hypothetical protein
MRLRSLLFAVLATPFMTLPVAAQDVNVDGAVTYLIPISVPRPSPGAFGTLWQTELWLYNGEESPMRLGACGDVSPPCGGQPLHAPGATEQADYGETFSTNGALVFDLPVGARIVLSSRLFELSRHAQPAGVEMPIVREDQFFTGASRFIGVPGSLGYRVALRVYNARRNAPPSAVRVEFLASDTEPVANLTMTISGSTGPSEPGYGAIYDLRSAVPGLAAKQRYDLRLTPLTAGLTYWALVSVTDQDTQQVLLITPMRLP